MVKGESATERSQMVIIDAYIIDELNERSRASRDESTPAQLPYPHYEYEMGFDHVETDNDVERVIIIEL